MGKFLNMKPVRVLGVTLLIIIVVLVFDFIFEPFESRLLLRGASVVIFVIGVLVAAVDAKRMLSG